VLKNKKQNVNNGFSQAVISYRSPEEFLTQFATTRILVVFFLVLACHLVIPQKNKCLVRLGLKTHGVKKWV
jgi:preprotein translocase subunit SecG